MISNIVNTKVTNQVKAELKAFERDIWQAHESQTPEHLFHYTSIEGLTGILSSRRIFLTDVLASSDRSEVRHGAQIALDALRAGDSHSVRTSLMDTFERYPLVGIGEDILAHIACFCPQPDVLTQWRGYSADGGFAIGFNFEQLLTRARASEFAVLRMLYDSDQQRAIVERIIAHAVDLYDRTWPTGLPDNSAEGNEFLLETGMSLLNAILHFKHPAFESENEWRVLTLDTVDKLDATLVKFRARGRTVMPYVELSFEPGAVSHIYKSPGTWPGSVEHGVKRLAASVGPHVVCGASTLPL